LSDKSDKSDVSDKSDKSDLSDTFSYEKSRFDLIGLIVLIGLNETPDIERAG